MISELQKNVIINTIMPFHPVQIGTFSSMARGENTENKHQPLLQLLETEESTQMKIFLLNLFCILLIVFILKFLYI